MIEKKGSFMRPLFQLVLTAVSILAITVSAWAQEAPTFRRVVVPAPDHTGPRITIQIEPRAIVEPEPEPEPLVQGPVEGPSGWFWSVVPSAIGAADRADIALRHLAQAPETADLPIASQSALRAMAEAHGAALLEATVGTEVSPALALAVIAVESSGRADAVSHAGAQGLMQLIPATADRFGVTDPFDPRQNIEGGVTYLDWLLTTFNQDPILALAGYNAGEGAVLNNGGVPDFAETRDYVPKVLATWTRVRELCLRRPDDLLDNCVFAVLAASN